jgi:hypothetical protein
MYPRFKTSFKRNAIPSVISLGTLISSAGTSLFGTIKIFELMYAAAFGEPENIPEWAHDLQIISYAVVIATNMNIIADTRFPAIFREYRRHVAEHNKKHNIEAEDNQIMDTIHDYLLHHDHPQANGHNIDLQYRAINDNGVPESQAYVVQVTQRRTANRNAQIQNGHNHVVTGQVVSAIPSHVVQAAQDVIDNKPYSYHFTKKAIAITLKTLGFSSITFASLNTYLGSITFFEYIGGDPAKQNYSENMTLFLQSLMYGGAAATVLCKFFTNYSFIYPSTKKNADKLSRWIMGEKNPLEDPADATTRIQDLYNYLGTIGLSFFNIVSSPFLAFYSTEQTLLKVPVVCNWATFIHYFAAASTVSSLTNDIISKSPSVHKAFLAWRSQTEDGSDEIQILLDAQLKFLIALNALIFLSGWIDSFATGANLLVSVINTSHSVFDVDRFNKELFFFAMLCGISATLVNYAFSIRRGHRDFMKKEIFPWCVERHMLDNVEAVLPDIVEETQVFEVIPTHGPQAPPQASIHAQTDLEETLLPLSHNLTEADDVIEEKQAMRVFDSNSPTLRVSIAARKSIGLFPAPDKGVTPLLIAEVVPEANPTLAFTL